ncbi:MAG TPA: riboflavin synthase [Chthoniobacterales bacterium]|nr:riboflavin synthase [Chthoniobacterales bacterium]
MFTGLIEEVGTVAKVDHASFLEISAPTVAAHVRIGDSVAVNGCCLTVARQNGSQLGFDVLQESFNRTNLKNLAAGSRVNLERALAAGAPLGGHFVQGHVDCASPIVALEESGADLRLEIALPSEFARYIAFKGSIAVNGISLTVAEIRPESFAVWIIPHTRAETNLATAQTADLVNLEFDLLAKYVERILERPAVRPE